MTWDTCTKDTWRINSLGSSHDSSSKRPLQSPSFRCLGSYFAGHALKTGIVWIEPVFWVVGGKESLSAPSQIKREKHAVAFRAIKTHKTTGSLWRDETQPRFCIGKFANLWKEHLLSPSKLVVQILFNNTMEMEMHKETGLKSDLYLFPAQQTSICNNIIEIDFDAQAGNKCSPGNSPINPK